MKIRNNILIAALVLALSSCHNPVFDDEGDCEVTYNIRFVYDMNLKWANAFPSEVTSINLYAFNEEGIFVKEFTDSGEALSDPTYSMQLNLEPGDYTLIGWFGLNNGFNEVESFKVTPPQPGVTTLDDLKCSLITKFDSHFSNYQDTMLNFLYHGQLEVSLPDSEDGTDYYYTMYLTKDTNHIRIILQQLSANNMSPEDYDFKIEAIDGELAYDNSILGNESITYLPWNKQTGVAGIGKESSSSLVYVDGVIADITMSRLMVAQQNEVMLTITSSSNGKIIASVPLIQYALLSKDYYEEAYRHMMSDQEFLDREDEFVLTFFLDENSNWISSYILIQSWRIVLHDYEVNNGY